MKKGDRVICIDVSDKFDSLEPSDPQPTCTFLVEGKTYIVDIVERSGENVFLEKYDTFFNTGRFMSLQEHRRLKIDKILKKWEKKQYNDTI